MKALKITLMAAVASVAMGGAALAQDSELTVSANIGVASDYVFRGVSQTDEGAQVFGGVDLGLDQFYAGVWASNVDFGDGTDAEVDLYAGFKPTLGAVSLDFAAIYYGYLDDDADWSYYELKAAGSVAAGPATLGAALYWTPDVTGASEESATYYEVNGSVPLAEKLSLSGAVGYQTFEDSDEYATWNVGLGYALTDKLGVDVRYHGTDVDDVDLYDDRVVASLKATF
jgi:uncharacterized protein (TIGR02001 family)